MLLDAAAQGGRDGANAELVLIYARAQAAAARATELRRQSQRMLAQAQALQQVIRDARRQRRSFPVDRERPHRCEHARLLARLETMPVIEQAKGIIMAQSHCGEAEAFDLLRRASQRSNIPVRDLAARIVAKAAGPAQFGSPPPIGL